MTARSVTFVVLSLCALSAHAQSGKPTPEEAKAFVAKTNAQMKDLMVRSAVAEWVKNNFITDDTVELAAWSNEALLGFNSATILAAKRFSGLSLDPETARMLHLMRLIAPTVAPSDPAKRQELAALTSKLDAMYGQGKWCGADGKAPCRDLQQLSTLLAKDRDYDKALDAWVGWHTISKPMRPLYEQYVKLGNEGAREVGFANTGDLWRSGYDMAPDAFQKEADRLWTQLKPLYEQLHCYVRAKLSERYGAARVKPEGPLPAHLLGNMWAQEWANIYPLVEPYKGQADINVDAALAKQKYDAVRMTKLGEAFFTSLGFDPLPETFWKRSLLVQPRDRDVVCHASAWDVHYNNDLRVKMCIRPVEEDLMTIHHELGHTFYFQSYYTKPVLFQQSANDGFHEAIGDAITLSITPDYLKKVGLLGAVVANEKNLINIQMKDALEKIAFLPFSLVVDRWRWDVFAGKTTPANYNAAWWELRRAYQGIDAPVPRTEADFDPGAKYHVPANVPYTRYFLARILQFQLHRALCKTAGHKGPLHTCSIYGNKDAGAKLKAMLSLGASKPWPDALEVATGERAMDATAMLEYFTPLRGWLEKQNQGKRCGW